MRFPGALLAVAAIAVAVTGCSAVDNASKSDVAKTKVGDCINITDNASNDTKGEAIDCSSPKAVYKVFQTFDNQTACPTTDYTTYTEQRPSGGTTFMCLAPNLKQDSCYNDVGTSPYKWADCGTPEATIKVLQRLEGTTDEMQCPEDTQTYITVPDPKALFCLGAPA
ncbi:hypothetical protein AB0H76_27750 [Nocardia sp. NPDC050712]|uniref:LppU/SCO3897 family protein n=1 Tax=Nocardia sp. NPDC050712 TaxID=3155518 RepID=UPI0033FC2508